MCKAEREAMDGPWRGSVNNLSLSGSKQVNFSILLTSENVISDLVGLDPFLT